MRYSKLFGKTVRESLRGTSNASTDLMYRGGFVRESVAGRYFNLPLGQRVQDKIIGLIREEMNESGAQEMLAPVLHPLGLWKETNRTNTAGFELMKIRDRREAEFALGGTAEEMFVDVVRKFQISYKDLPFNIYQFSLKFRDEQRARGGLLRAREFIMKDAYSFHVDAQDFEKEYKRMINTYTRIFARLGLPTFVVDADNGYIGGEYCHEFVVESDVGESRFFLSEDGKYSAHEDVAKFWRDPKNLDDDLQPYQEVKAVRGTTMEDGVELHNLPLWQQVKDFMAVDEKGNLILAVIRGDLEVNEMKLAHVVGAVSLRHATVEEIQKIGSEPGFISPVGLKGKVKIVGDLSLRTVKNMYGGANKKHVDALNMNIDRDYTVDIEADIAMVQAGHLTEDTKSPLEEHKGIEVGNVFQLGYHYSTKMADAEFVNEQGEKKPYYMGCYGIGVSRTMAAIVEKHFDEKGIVWPKAVAPFQVHLVGLKDASDVYTKLQEAGVDVLYDDTDRQAGQKFADADLIGIPVRLVVSEKAGDKIEFKLRNGTTSELLDLSEVVKRLI